MNKKFLVVIIFIFVFAGGFLGGYFWSTKNKARNQKNPNDTFKAGWEAAQKRLAETSSYFQIKQVPVKIITGSVIKVYNNLIYLKVAPLSPLADRELDERIVKISKNTKIYKMVKKPDDQYRDELKEFYDKNPEAINSAGIEVPLPSPYQRVKAKFEDIGKGQILAIESEKDISKQKNIVAKTIVIQ